MLQSTSTSQGCKGKDLWKKCSAQIMIPWSDDDQDENDLTICWKCWWWSNDLLKMLMMIWWSWKVLIWQNELAATFPRCLLHLQVVDSPRCIMVKMNFLNYIHLRLESFANKYMSDVHHAESQRNMTLQGNKFNNTRQVQSSHSNN